MSHPVQPGPVNDVAGLPPLTKPTGGEGTDWRKVCEELMSERDQLRQELAKTKEERDSYLRAFYAILPVEEFEFTKEEIFANLGKKPTLHELIEELKREAGV